MPTLVSNLVTIAIPLALSIAVVPAGAVTQVLAFDTLNASGTVASTVNAGDTVFVDTLVRSSPGALSQSTTFALGAGVTGLTGQVAWMISSAAGQGPRLTGFNVDLIDTSTNTVVASDSFSGTLGGVAHSNFSTPLGGIGPGIYRLEATGTGVRDSLFDLALSFTGDLPVVTSVGSGTLPAQGPTTSGQTAYFSKLFEARAMTSPFGAGDTLIVDSLVTSETDGALQQSVTFTLDAGVEGLTGAAMWAISTAAGPGPRLIGVNIDLFDMADNLIQSDLFTGVLDGFAQSTFDNPIGPGTYKLVASGTGVRDSSLSLALTFGGRDLPDNSIPEPTSMALVTLALGGLAAARRRKKAS